MKTLSGLKVGISGATGMIGSALVEALEAEGAEVRTLSRGDSGTHRWELEGVGEGGGAIEEGFLEGLDLLVHLAGENIGSGRFTESRKAALKASRVDTMALLAREIERGKTRPAQLITASAVGYYGDRGDEILDESSAAGSGFLAELCAEWEAAALKVKELGVAVSIARIGLVFAERGGLLERLRPLMRTGLGGALGDGSQWMSPIHIDDLIAALLFIAKEKIEGPVNLVAPEPLTNAEFTRVYADVLRRPAVMRAPRWALGLVLGKETSAELLFSSQRVRPRVLLEAGFKFRYETAEDALRAIEGVGPRD